MRHLTFVMGLLLALGACQPTTATDAPTDAHDDDAHDARPGADDHEAHDAHDEAEGDEGIVRLAPAAIARHQIRTAPVTQGALTASFEVRAQVQPNPDKVAHISPLVPGQLLSVEVSEGDQVSAKQPLARLRSVELGLARAALRSSTARRDDAAQTLDRQQRLRDAGINAERALIEAQLSYEQAEAERDAARSRLRAFGASASGGPDLTLESPLTGVVVARHATQGENVAPDTTLFTVCDLSRVWIIGQVYEQQLADLKPGMRATLSLSAYPGRVWDGEVSTIGAMLDETTQTLSVRVELDNPDGLLRPGLWGTLRLSAPPAPSEGGALAPRAAVQTVDGQPMVFVEGEAPGEFIARPVTLGRADAQQVELLAGVTPGTPIAVTGTFTLKAELTRAQLGHGHAH